MNATMSGMKMAMPANFDEAMPSNGVGVTAAELAGLKGMLMEKARNGNLQAIRLILQLMRTRWVKPPPTDSADFAAVFAQHVNINPRPTPPPNSAPALKPAPAECDSEALSYSDDSPCDDLHHDAGGVDSWRLDDAQVVGFPAEYFPKRASRRMLQKRSTFRAPRRCVVPSRNRFLTPTRTAAMSSDTHPPTPERLPTGPNADASPPTDPTPSATPLADDSPSLATPPADPPMSAPTASSAETPPLSAAASTDTANVPASFSAVGSSDVESGPTLQPGDFAAAHVELRGETVPVYRPRHSDSPPASSPPFAAATVAASAAGPVGEPRSPSSMSAKLTALSAKSQAAKDPAPRVYGEPPSPLHVVLWPVAAAALAILVVAGIGMDLVHAPIIPLIALAFVCIGCWEFRWARQIWYVALITSGLWLIVHTIPIWLPFFFGLVIAYILSPLVDWIEAVLLVRFYVPVMAARTAAVFALFFLGLVLFVALDAFFISNVLETGKNLEQQFSGQDFEGVVARNIENLLAQFGVDVSEGSKTSIQIAAALSNFTGQVSTYVNSNLDSLLGTAGRAFGYLAAVLLDIIIMLFVVFFLLLDFPAMTAKMQGYFSPDRSKRLNKLSRELSKILRQYLQGHSAVCVFVGLIFYVVLALMGHPYAGLLALIMGVFTFIPLIGPLTAGIVALVVTLTVPEHVGFYLIAVLVGYAVCQGLNDLILYPMIAGRSVKLHPVAALLVLFLIGHSFGIVGMFFAVPLTAMVRALIAWMNEEHIPGFEWLKMLRPYEVRHARTLMLQRAEMLKRSTGIFRAASDADSPDAPDAPR